MTIEQQIITSAQAAVKRTLWSRSTREFGATSKDQKRI